MPLRDYLDPDEQVRYRSPMAVQYVGKDYQVIITDRKFILFSRAEEVSLSPVGGIVKTGKDEAVSQQLNDITRHSYKEKGFVGKKGIITLEGKTDYALTAAAREMRQLHEILKQVLGR
ncbi:MAG: hypothetical protein ACE5KO_00960 [Candidatus Bathyarchaeia archaeon]